MPKNPEREGSPSLITPQQIEQEYGIKRSTLYTYRHRPTFPKPVKVEGSIKTFYRADEVAAWLEANPKQQGKRTDLATKQHQGDPVSTTVDPRIAILSALNSPPYDGVAGLRGMPLGEAAQLLDAYRAAVVTEVVGALQERGGELSELAEEQMRPSLEERAQEWYEAAGVAEKLKQRKPEV